jgi:peptide deformylase
MPVLPILPKTDASLQPSEKVSDFNDPQVLKCIAALTDTLAAEQSRLDLLHPGAGGGVGLAANQLGFTFDIYIVSVREVRALRENCETVKPTIYINSTFEPLANPDTGEVKRTFTQEACLSVSGFQGQYVPRYDNIKISAQNTAGKEIIFTANSFIARIHQHEIDHSQGQEYLDHLHLDSSELQQVQDWLTIAKRGAPVDLTLVKNKLTIMPIINNQLLPAPFRPDIASLECWIRNKSLQQDQSNVLRLERTLTSLSFYNSPIASSPSSTSSSVDSHERAISPPSAASPPSEKSENHFTEEQDPIFIRRKM